MLTDPIGTCSPASGNAGTARHREVRCSSSKLRLAVARVLEAEGFVQGVRVEAREGKPELVIGVCIATTTDR